MNRSMTLAAALVGMAVGGLLSLPCLAAAQEDPGQEDPEQSEVTPQEEAEESEAAPQEEPEQREAVPREEAEEREAEGSASEDPFAVVWEIHESLWFPGEIIALAGLASMVLSIVPGAIAVAYAEDLRGIRQACVTSPASCDLARFDEVEGQRALAAGFADFLLFGGLAAAATGAVLAFLLAEEGGEGEEDASQEARLSVSIGPSAAGASVSVPY